MKGTSSKERLTTNTASRTKEKYRKRRRKASPTQQFVQRVWKVGAFLLIFIWVLKNAKNSNQTRRHQQWLRAQHLTQQLLHPRGGDSAGPLSHRRGPRPQPKLPRDVGIRPVKISQYDLVDEYDQLESSIVNNTAGGIRWISKRLLPTLPGQPQNPLLVGYGNQLKLLGTDARRTIGKHPAFNAHRRSQRLAWQQETFDEDQPPAVDYTKHSYQYPSLLPEPPPQGGYPQLRTLGELLERWPQDELDHPPSTIQETLLHFNYSNPQELEMARKFRDQELPFKLYDVPEVTQAGQKWTDDYLSQQFDGGSSWHFGSGSDKTPPSSGRAQESPNNYFAFFTRPNWNVDYMGPPPVRDNDMSFKEWAAHSRYADSVGLDFDRPHFYWQSGVPKQERLLDESQWTFVSRDLPSFSSPTETFFVFSPEEQKGIQCRFGERGVTAATHYDGGRNMVAMMTGAKRYVLSPPRECSKLGIVTQRGSAIFRHSLLNFAHVSHLETEEGKSMSPEERAWLEAARGSEAIDTVLKAGEVLYIPSHWFHYIISVQKSAQCNVRSGVNVKGTKEFGGAADVYSCGYEE